MEGGLASTSDGRASAGLGEVGVAHRSSFAGRVGARSASTRIVEVARANGVQARRIGIARAVVKRDIGLVGALRPPKAVGAMRFPANPYVGVVVGTQSNRLAKVCKKAARRQQGNVRASSGERPCSTCQRGSRRSTTCVLLQKNNRTAKYVL